MGQMKTKIALFTIPVLVALALALTSPGSSAWPSPPRQFTVVIDPGHGGRDPGGTGWLGIKEKNVTLAIAHLVAIEALSEPQLRVVLTRRSDVYVPLGERTALANRLGASLYLSIHANIHRDQRVRGIETLLPQSWRGRSWRSVTLARDLQANLVRELASRDRGVKYQRLYLRWSEVPAALVEVGFLSNPEEARLLQSLSHQDQIARAILAAIKEYLGLG